MQLSRQVEWTLHCCLELAEHSGPNFLSTRELARRYQLPKEYLSKTLQALSRAGLLDMAMGPSGGYRLTRCVSEISILEIVEAIEGKDPTYIETGIGQSRDGEQGKAVDCKISALMTQADEAWRGVLRGVTLKDLRLSGPEATDVKL